MYQPSEDAEVVLEVRGATKRFGAVCALDGVDVTLRAGEVLALLGDNGAGKSTLVKAINGVHPLDEGTITIGGRRLSGRGTHEAKALGVETVYQDLALFDNLSVGENLFAGRELVRPAWSRACGVRAQKSDGGAREGDAQRAGGRRAGSGGDGRPDVGRPAAGDRGRPRAQAFASKIVMLDEPTAALGLRESRAVLGVISRLPQRGVGVVLISHNMEHVAEVADRAIVMRRGRVVGEAVPTPENHARIVQMIVGGHVGMAV